MLSTDIDTYKNLNRLEAVVREHKRPLVIWVGAGVSTWAGYPLWNELAAKMHSEFSRSEPRYDAAKGAELLANGLLPQLFYNISESNSTRYLAALSAEFQPKEVSPLFDRLIQALLKLKCLHLLTTNVDESLERRLPDANLLQRSDFEGISGLLSSGSPFICKLHGSVSSIKSAVFTSSDYDDLIADSTYLKLLREIFSVANILFLGYSVRDEYVLRALLDAVGERVLFGAGEHFVVCSEGAHMPSDHLRPIRYVVDEKSDHRTSLQALEIAAAASGCDTAVPDIKKTDPNEVDALVDRRSTYFLADLLPFGTSDTSHVIRFRGEDSVEREMIMGQGYIRGEVETSDYSPMHDIVVGLLCFDTIGVSLSSIGKLHTILGSELFWLLVSEDIIRVIHSTEQTGLVYERPGELIGGNLWDLQTISPGSHLGEPVPMSVGEIIRRMLKSATGDERQVTDLFVKLESKVTTAPQGKVSNAVRSALAHPSIRKLLGVSIGTPATKIPRWVAYPVLRLASVITTGEFCRHLDASAARMLWGSERLAGAAFSVFSAENWTDDAASYALAGRFNMDLGALVQRAPDAIKGVLAFRRTPGGDRFRAEVRELLAINEAGELSLAINSGLRQAIAPSILEQARDQLSGLFVPRQQEAKIMPAVFGDLRNGDARIARWRARSREMLKTACAELKLQPYDACPCGSGEKLKFCCFEALRS